MNREGLEELYTQLIIPESKEPYRFEKKDDAHVLAYNPVCGDKFKIYIDEPICFHGHGCALSKTSGSLLMRLLENQSLAESRSLIKNFIEAVESGNEGGIKDETLATLVTLKKNDGREDCILLAWRAMLEYLEDENNSLEC